MRRILLSILILMAMIPVSNARTLRILSFNIREWTRDLDAKGEYYWRDRMEAMTKMLEDMDPDVICLQEVLPPAGRYVPEGYRRVGIGEHVAGNRHVGTHFQARPHRARVLAYGHALDARPLGVCQQMSEHPLAARTRFDLVGGTQGGIHVGWQLRRQTGNGGR